MIKVRGEENAYWLMTGVVEDTKLGITRLLLLLREKTTDGSPGKKISFDITEDMDTIARAINDFKDEKDSLDDSWLPPGAEVQTVDIPEGTVVSLDKGCEACSLKDS